METQESMVIESFELEVQTICSVEKSNNLGANEPTGTGVTVTSSMVF